LWPADQSWSIGEDQVRAHIANIDEVEQQTAQTRAMVAREPAPVANEGGIGVTKSDKDWERQGRR
jgi:hypothetical protein